MLKIPAVIPMIDLSKVAFANEPIDATLSRLRAMAEEKGAREQVRPNIISCLPVPSQSNKAA